MTTPLPLPIRILVKGPSTVIVMSEKDVSCDHFTFPRALEQALLAAGRPAEVRVSAMAGDRAKDLVRSFESEVLGWSPDVVIVLNGQYEAMHYVLPYWLERHANSLATRPGRIREFYRRRLIRPVWFSLARFQARADATFDSHVRRRRPRRMKADLRRYIERTLPVNRPLILLWQFLTPRPRVRSWFPGMGERTLVINAAIAELVAEFDDPAVRLFDLPEVVARRLPEDDDPAPDGLHYTAKLHRIIGEELCEIVSDWADLHEHIRLKPD
jgi:hypothetical protein